jgi:hypothetical protein
MIMHASISALEGPAMHRTRLSRIVVRRPGAPGTALGPALARCSEDPSIDRATRAADVVWRPSRVTGRRVGQDAQPADRRVAEPIA